MLEEIRDIKSSIWISASAGTGKTKCLIDRILALLIQGVQPNKILCLTYTKSAASEMLERLSVYIQKLAKIPETEMIFELSKLGFNASYASIIPKLYELSLSTQSWVQVKTIHSFCFGILQKFPLETGLMPGFKLCDDYQMRNILKESVRRVIANSENHQQLSYIAQYLSNFNEIIEAHALELTDFLSRNLDLEKIYCDYFNIEFENLKIDDETLINNLMAEIFSNNYRKIFSKFSECYSFGGKEDIGKSEILKNALNSDIEGVIKVFLKENGELRARLCSKDLIKKFPNLQHELQDTALKTLNFCEQKNRIIATRATITFFSILQKIIFEFIKLKKDEHVVDFNDIILISQELLNNIDWVMYKIDGRIDHILVDEAQDTSAEQWKIITLLTNEFFDHSNSGRTILVVGDEKQSIYSFQGADMRLFREMHEYFKQRALDCGQNFYDVTLNKSYRTTGNILRFVDNVFENIFSNVTHLTNRASDHGVVEFVDLFASNEESEEKVDSLQNYELSDYIADTIDEILKNQVFVESKKRQAQPSDFLVLFQRRDIEEIEKIRAKLKEKGIDVAGIDRVLLKDELLVQDLIVFAEFAVFPKNDLACARVLKSPIIGFSEADLMKVCLARGEQELWEYLLKNEEMTEKYPLLKLKEYIDRVFELSVSEFFISALVDGLKERFINRLGERCLEVLNEFLDVVTIYEQNNDESVQNFIDWFADFEHEIKRENFSSGNQVRIMTVHASKGLQAPFVILADTNFSCNTDEKIMKSEEGLLLWNFVSEKRPEKLKKLCEKYVKLDFQESQRLMYVAMTRAEDFLYILGKQNQKSLNENCWYKIIENNMKVEKFIKTERKGVQLKRVGDYSYSSENFENRKLVKNENFAIPEWYFEKISFENTENEREMAENLKNADEVFYFLKQKMLNYSIADQEDFFEIANDFLVNFEIDAEEKEKIINQCYMATKKKRIENDR